MILTPKNWNSFQHYKDRAPSWIKLHKALLDDFEFSCLPVASKALAPLLWLLASEYDDGRIDATLDKLAFRLRMTRGDLADALSPLVQKGFFDASEPLAEPEQASSLEKEIENIDKRREDIPTVAKATRRDEQFEEFWKAYPRRDGANPKSPAEKLFLAAVKGGEPPENIIRGARVCATLESKHVGTPFIPQAVKWLRDKRWRDYQEPIAVKLVTDWDAICISFKRFGVWSKWEGPPPGSVGCRCPVEILEKHGLTPPGGVLPPEGLERLSFELKKGLAP